MKRLLIALFLLANPAFPAIALVSSVTGHCANTCTVTTSSINTTGANLIVVTVGTFGGNSCNQGWADSKSNTWSKLPISGTPYSASSAGTCMFYASGTPTVGSGHTFTLTGLTGVYPSFVVAAFSGANATPFDQINGAGASSGTSVQTGSVTPTACNELILSGYTANGTTTGALAINSGMSIIATIKNADGGVTSVNSSLAYVVQTAIAAINPTWSDSGNSVAQAAEIVTFKAVSGCASPNVPRSGRAIFQ